MTYYLKSERNNHNDNSLFIRGVESIQKEDKLTYKELCNKLEEVAYEGKPAEFQDNTRRIRYCTRDEFKKFCLHWIVVNVVSGREKVLYTKDYVGKAGGIYWRSLASAVRRV